MKHLIETENPSGLAITEYDRLILNSATNDVIVKGGGYDANILMVSDSGYQLYGEEGDDGQINYLTYEYAGMEEYNGKDYFKYSLSETDYILAPTRNITKVNFPFDDYYECYDGKFYPFSESGWDSLYGFTSVPENKVVMKPRTDIGTNANGKDCVDLGLTSGTLWATMNVGATSETDYGSYFQWGDTVDKSNAVCDWSTYKHCNGTAGATDENVKFTKYNVYSSSGTVDNKITLDIEDDAARANMGGDWRIPSLALMEELVSETNNVSATINGVKGWKFTSKKEGYQNNSIFIPASGYRGDSSFNHQGNQGFVWITLLARSSKSLAYCLHFDSNSTSATSWTATRCYGLTVRGVL